MATELTNRDREIASAIAAKAFVNRRGRDGAKRINYRQMPRAELYHSLCAAILQSKTPSQEAPGVCDGR